MSDSEEITQLIMRERQGRDRGWWEHMRQTFWPDATLRLSWIDGSATDFVEGSRKMAGASGAPYTGSPFRASTSAITGPWQKCR